MLLCFWITDHILKLVFYLHDRKRIPWSVCHDSATSAIQHDLAPECGRGQIITIGRHLPLCALPTYLVVLLRIATLLRFVMNVRGWQYMVTYSNKVNTESRNATEIMRAWKISSLRLFILALAYKGCITILGWDVLLKIHGQQHLII